MSHTEYVKIYTDLIDICHKEIKKEGVSDAYIREFFMFIVICNNNNKPFEYPFVEFERIIKIIKNNSYLESEIIKILNYKQNSLNFTENLDKHLQEFFIDKMKYYFSQNVLSTQIELCNLNFFMNKNLIYSLKIINNVKISTIIDLFKQYTNITSNNLIFIKDKKNMEINKTLLHYKVNKDDSNIEVVISQSS
jgi:hypothetical protein